MMRRVSRALSAISVFAFACLVLLPFTSAADCLDYREPYLRSIAQLGGDSGHSPVIAGNRLLLPCGNGGLKIYSLADPALPELVGTVILPGVWYVACLGDIAVISNAGNGITVVNIADPGAPVVLGSVAIPGGAGRVAIHGRYAYVANGANGVRVVSLVDPAHPFIFDTIPVPSSNGDASDVAVAGDILLVAAGAAGLISVSVASPHGAILDTLASAPWCDTVAAEGDRACVSRSWSGLSVIDISNPRELRLLGSCAARGYTDYVAMSGTHALLFDYYSPGTAPGPGVLFTFDIADPEHPRISGMLDQGEDGRGVTVNAPYAYLAGGGGLWVLDARNLESAPTISSIGSGSTAGAAGQDARYHCLVWAPRGWCGTVLAYLSTLDLSEPASPRELGVIDLSGLGYCGAPEVARSGDFAYVAANGELDVVSVAVPAYPTVTGRLDLTNPQNGIAAAGSIVYVACGSAGLQIVDASNPAAPALAAAWGAGGEVNGVTVANEVAYVAMGHGGLDILDVGDPYHPALLGHCQTPGTANGIALQGATAFVASGDAGLAIVDCSAPAAPALLGVADTPGGASRVAVDEAMAYVADGWSGFAVIDTHDLSAPALLASVSVPGGCHGVSVDANYVYDLSGDDGYEVRPKQCALSTTVAGLEGAPGDRGLRIYPNPTRDEARISFGLGTAAGVRVSIYDVTGRRVREIPPATPSGARLEYRWDGRDDHGRALPSGIYLIQARWNGGASSGRLVFMR